MRKRFLKTAAAMMAIGLVFSTCSVTALADIDGVNESNVVNNVSSNDNDTSIPENEKDKTINENKSSGDIDVNNGTVTTNNGNIDDNNGNVGTNNHTIGNNDGNVGTNGKDGTITNNNGTVTDNKGTIKDNISANEDTHSEGGKVSTNSGTIEKNEGTVNENTESGIIDKNTGSGFVGENNGTINENSAKAESSEYPQSSATDGGGVDENNGTIVINSGFVENNNGTIKNNSGFVENNGVTESYISYPVESDLTDISDSDIEYSDSYTPQDITVTEPIATIGNNTGIVQINGDISEAEKSGEYDENALVINLSGGIVEMNNGIVENHTGGKVVDNNGAVFNYGGEVIKTYSGIEYFSVSVSTDNGSTGYGQGFTEYKDTNWLGQTYDWETSSAKTSSADVTISPNSGYEINELTIPDEYKDYVKATKNDDGSWTLSVTSGYNIKLTPTATLIATSTLDNSGNSGIPGTSGTPGTSGNQGNTAVSVEVSVSSDSDSDSNDSGNKPAQNNNDFQVAPPGSMMNQMMVNSVDFIGQGLSAPLSDVLQKIDNITAINNFQAMGRVIPSNENIMACGVVDFKNAFVNAATGNVDVPVEATVIAGNTYTVALSDGTIIEVQCTTNGILNIPFAANAQNLTFIIYGVQSNPFTASLE
ncbi:MAG: hypothetical protein J6M92_06580 [Oribacterium sp.]|nr:hypothetical protein [Oribacterium sp.]